MRKYFDSSRLKVFDTEWDDVLYNDSDSWSLTKYFAPNNNKRRVRYVYQTVYVETLAVGFEFSMDMNERKDYRWNIREINLEHMRSVFRWRRNKANFESSPVKLMWLINICDRWDFCIAFDSNNDQHRMSCCFALANLQWHSICNYNRITFSIESKANVTG